ncbi:MAG: O-antigen ligase family protein [Marinobacter sp.]|uniref:O-antigen ligase family protein n=1 Tax=Marinobacter sp. TaxID=50741 RepID=UPI0029C58164|nr:O-antigen ligase family protein [Marinobacter sp.]MDX5386347.1 O-antigen ligase family protein [Marinobacter sp.]MDX5471831.1 O-antigen ligase family protein [Marinobacter sp.]
MTLDLPAAQPPSRRVTERTGLAGLVLFAFGGFLNQGLFYSGLILMLLACLWQAVTFWPRVRHEPFFWVTLALFGYVATSWLTAAWHYGPEWRPGILKYGADLLISTGIFSLAAAFWMRGDPRRIRLVLVLALASLTINLIIGFDWSELGATLAGRRNHFGMGNGAPLYAAIGLTGIIVLLAHSRKRPECLIAVAAPLALLFSLVIFWSQTRAIWVASALVFPLLVLYLAWHHWRKGASTRKVAIATLAAAGILVVIGAMNSDIITKRLTQHEMRLSGTGDTSWPLQTTDNSTQLRLLMWQEALIRIEEKPVIGWGAGSSSMLIQTSDVVPHRFRHFHNLYLQLLAELGIIGMLLITSWVTLALKTALEKTQNHFEGGLRTFILSAMALFALSGIFMIRHDDEYGQFFLILIIALCVTGMFAPENQASKSGDQ